MPKKKVEKKVVGKSSSKSKKYTGPRYIRKDGTKFDTQNLPWGVELTKRGTIEYRLANGQKATYSKWKEANKKHWAEVSRERYKQKKKSEEASLAAALEVENIARQKAEDARKKEELKLALALEKQAAKDARRKKTWQEETDEWKASLPPVVIHKPPQSKSKKSSKKTSSSTPSTEGVKPKTTSATQFQKEPQSELELLKITLQKELSVLNQNTQVGEKTYNRIVGNKAYAGLPKRFETYIRDTDRLIDAVSDLIKNTNWKSWNPDIQATKKRAKTQLSKVLDNSRKLDFLLANVSRIDETVNKGDALDEEIEKELSEIDKLSDEALDQLKRRKEADQKNFPEKFETEEQKKRRKRSTMHSGIADAFGLGFENEKKLFRRLFSPFINEREEIKEQALNQKYQMEGISDADIENNPLFEGVNPATVSKRDYTAKEKIKRNAERMKKAVEKELRRRGVNPNTTSNTINNVGGTSTASSTSSNNSKNTTNNFGGSSSSSVKGGNIFNNLKGAIKSIPSLPGAAIDAWKTYPSLDLNRTDDDNPIVEEQQETNVILGKILKKFDNLRGSGGGLLGGIGDLLGGVLGGGLAHIPTPGRGKKGGNGWWGKGGKLSRGVKTAGRWGLRGARVATPIGLVATAGITAATLAANQSEKNVERAKNDPTYAAKLNRDNLYRGSLLTGGYIPPHLKNQSSVYSNSNSRINSDSSNKQTNPITAVDTNKIQNIYDNNRGLGVDFSSHETFMIKTFAPALAKAIAGEIGTKDTTSRIGIPGMNFF